MEQTNERLLALRAKAMATGFTAPAPKNPATIGQLACGRQSMQVDAYSYGKCYGTRTVSIKVLGRVVKIDGMFIWVESDNATYKMHSLGCTYTK